MSTTKPVDSKTAEIRVAQFTPCKPELRAAGEKSSGPGTVTGYAVVWGALSSRIDDFREKFRAGAFAECLNRGQDVRALGHHQHHQLIGRRSANTLRLREDATGLAYEIDLPDTSTGRDLAESVRRRDLDGTSFEFSYRKQQWTDMRSDEAFDADFVREVIEADIFEISLVTWPAYEQTSAQIREAERPSLLEVRSKQIKIPTTPTPPVTPKPDGGSLSVRAAQLRQAIAVQKAYSD